MSYRIFRTPDECLDQFFIKFFETIYDTKWPFGIVVSISLIVGTIYVYFVFASILQLTVYAFVYEELSLFGLDNYKELIISIIINLSDFGMFFILILFCIFVIKDFISIIKLCFYLFYLIFIKKETNISDDENIIKLKDIIKEDIFTSKIGAIYSKFISKIANSENPKRTLTIFIWIIYIFLAFLNLLMIGAFDTQEKFALMIKILEIGILIVIFLGGQIVSLIAYVFGCFLGGCVFKNSDTYSDISMNNIQNNHHLNESLLNNNDNKLSTFSNSRKKCCCCSQKDEEKKEENIKPLNGIFSFLKISLLKGMFKTHDDIKYPTCHLIYKAIVGIIIFTIQMYSVIYPYFNKIISPQEYASFILINALFMYKIIAFNLIDGLLHPCRTKKSLFSKGATFVYWAIIVSYIISITFFFVLGKYFNKSVYPTIKSATFIEDNEKWFKLNNTRLISPEPYCSSQSKIDGTLKTTDFAMLTTLPRLYSFYNNSKCYIKPSMRGLFNSTMKYIFGKDYEKDNILIMCKKFTNYPILIITSEKIMQKSLTYFSSDTKIAFLEKQFQIENNDYFQNNPNFLDNVTEEGLKYYNAYQNCASKNKNCEYEWDVFTQYYWKNTFTDDYVDIAGFERYQITLNSNMTIQPSFITQDKKLMSGTHYIVGGSFEDKWGVGLFMESFGRKNLPKLFDIIPMYLSIRNYLRSLFLSIESFNRRLIYTRTIAPSDMKKFTELFTQFNFSHDALFLVGHSIMGTEMKGVSYFTDIQGISFESSIGENIGYFDFYGSFIPSKNSKNNIVNLYSKSNYFSGFDGDCIINGELPKRYYVPSVYDTACLTAISCSENKKYIPFCIQVLNQKGKDPIKEFNISFKAFLSEYDYI